MHFSKVFILISSLTYAQHALSNEVLTVLAENNAPPFSNPDGSGLSNSLVKAAYAEVDISVKFKVVPFVRLLKHLDRGEYVIGLNAAPTYEIRNKYYFNKEPLFSEPSSYYVLNDSPLLKLKQRDDLLPATRIGVIDGFEYGDFIHRNTNKLSIKKVQNHLQNFKKLVRGRLDAVLMFDSIAQDVLINSQYKYKLIKHFAGEELHIHAVFSKHHSKSTHYLRLLDSGLEKIRANGKYEEIITYCADPKEQQKRSICL